MARSRGSVTVGRQGRLVIPARVRGELGLEEGDRLSLEVRGGKLVLAPDRANVDRLRGMFRDLAPSGEVVDELLSERREEAALEDAD